MRKIWAFCIILVIFGSLFGQEGAEYLIITHDDFAQTINSLAEWKYMKGLQTKVVKLSEIGEDPSNDDIRNFIITAYDTWDPQPEYVLVVGDIGFLPVGQSSPCRSDNHYANMEGDFKAELSVGRFPCQSAYECSTMVNKIMAYERTPWLEDTLWFKKSTIVIRFDDAADTIGYYVDDLRYIRDTCMIPDGFSVDSLFWRAGSSWHNQGPDSALCVIEALNNGRGFLVYRGHSVNDWYAPFNGIPESPSLVNGSKLPIIFAGACTSVLTGNSVGEKWLCAGTPDMLKGAVGYIGNTRIGYYASFRHHLNRAFFKAICIEDSLILGHAFLRAKDSLYANYPNDTASYVECNLLGDPTLQLWTEVPKSMTVQHPAVIEMDVPIDLVITVYDTESQLPIQGALVTLYKPDGPDPEIYESIITNSEGIAVFENLTVPTSGTMYATTTFHNYVPYQGEIQVYEMMTDDPLALAYNGNRHLVRKPRSGELHLVYTDHDEVIYRYSSNGGTDWTLPEIIGEGNYPAITLNSDHLSSVAWTDDEGGLWYGKQNVGGEWNVYHLHDPSPYDPYLNTPPSIVVTRSLMGDTVHILATLFLEDIEHLYGAVAEYVFPIQNPGAYTVKYIEGGTAPNHKFCYNPSITKDFQERLHAVWQRGDTLCYATRMIRQDWNNWGPQFGIQGLQSAHPFVETYGDSVFVVWQREVDEEVYRAARHLGIFPPYFIQRNLSRTPRKVSLYPVNASGLVATFVDEPDSPPPDDWYEIYWKRKPEDPLNNISQSPHVKSIYPHTSLKFNQIADNQLYVVWQEGNISPYEIKFKMVYVPDRASAFFSSNSGNPEPSPYLVARDTFFDNWTIPVDVGDESITYRFPLEPGYLYKAKTIAYHESSGEWQGRIKIDNAAEFLVRYNAHMPETLEIWIPPVLYQDSIVEVAFSRLAGDYAAMGPLYIYRYEYEEGRGGSPGGPMAQNNKPFDNTVLTISPTLFCQALSIRFQTQIEKKINVKVYDVSGRLVKNIYKGKIKGNCTLNWNSDDENGRIVSDGVYFIRFEDRYSGTVDVRKVLKVR